MEGLKHKIQTFAREHARQNRRNPGLAALMPAGESADFWWYQQSCEFAAASSVREAIISDNKRSIFNIYDAYKYVICTSSVFQPIYVVTCTFIISLVFVIDGSGPVSVF